MSNYVFNNGDFEFVVGQEQARIKKDITRQYIESRKLKKMTQKEVANVSGIKRPNITRFEKENYNPTIDMLVKVAESLGKELKIKLVDKVEIENRERDHRI